MKPNHTNPPNLIKNPKSKIPKTPIILSILTASYLYGQINNPQNLAQEKDIQTPQNPRETAQQTQDLPYEPLQESAPQQSNLQGTNQQEPSPQEHDVQEPNPQEHILQESTPPNAPETTTQKTMTTPTTKTPTTQTTQQKPFETKELDRVVTTGTALQSDIATIPGNVSIITAKAINSAPNTKITDIIATQAGVHIDNNTSFNPRPKVKIRGINYGTLVLLDGVILSDLEGEARILNQIFLNEVERVEIARGASSAVYGTGAIGGAINFITSMPKKLEIKANAGYGSAFVDGEADRHTASAYLSIGNAFFDKRLKVKIHGGFRRTESYANSPAYLNSAPNNGVSGFWQDKRGRYILGTNGEREVNIYDIGLKASYELGERDEISATFRFSNHNYDTKNYKTYLKDSSGNPTFLINGENKFIGAGQTGLGTYSHILGSLNYLHSFDNGVLRVQASSLNLLSKWQDSDSKATQKPTFESGQGRGQDIDTSNNYLDLIYEDFHYDRQKFTLGAQARYHRIAQTTPKLTNWRDSSTRNDYYNKYGGEAFVASIYGALNSTWVDSAKYGTFGSSIAGRFDNWVNFNNYIEDTENSSNAELNKKFDLTYLPVFSPNIALHYTPLDTFADSTKSPQSLMFKTSVGYGFRMATMREKYFFNFSANGEQRAHNPNLKHEQAISFEIGTEYKSKWINTSLYFYNIEMFDMIYQAGDGSSSSPYKRENAGRARINGIEYTLELPIYHALNFGANYTLTNTEFLTNTQGNSAKPSTKGNSFPAIPKHSANFSLNYAPNYGIYGSLWAHYTSAFFYDDANTRIWGLFGSYDEQFTLNAKLGYAFRNGIDLSAQFLNMTNNRYYDYYIVPGASFYLQIGYKL
ncbi:TonB-dependent receptor domain-containing protein [Helicobacter sp. T3_23-1059]